MADHAPTSPESPAPQEALALYLHATGERSADQDWADELSGLGIPAFSHRALDGVERTEAGLDAFGRLCGEIAARAPGRALLVLRRPLSPSRALFRELTALLDRAPGLGVYTVFSNAETRCNPYAGLPADRADGATRERLVTLLGAGRLLPLDRWPDHLLAITPRAVESLADSSLDWSAAPGRMRSHRVQAELADWLYVDAPGMDPGREDRLEPHEERRPMAWGALSERLQAWLEAIGRQPDLADRLPFPGEAPVTLHVTHSWGGGVAAWVRSMIDGDPDGLHLQLRSEGPQTGQGAGQRLALYLGNHTATPLDQWWLQPAIRAVDTVHEPYREVLESVCRRFGVGRVIVSSLVGHSLDALRTECPTVQVLHDAFPAWPLLSVHPDEYGADLEAAMADPRAREQFPEMSLEDWRRIAAQYDAAARGVPRVAPSESARSVQATVDQELQGADITVVPHGLPPLPGSGPVMPRSRSDGRLRVVVPGRVQSGKGADLLAQALPGLRSIAHVTLLGAGKGGERFFGIGGVNVVLNYERDELPDLLRELAPHCAVLPSVVPETFSYTLSEMFALGIPVVATRLGSFVERVEEGVTGWLVDPNPEALVARLDALAREPEALAAVRERLAARPSRSLEAMVADYDALCPAERTVPRRPALSGARLGLAEAQAASARDLLRRSRTALLEAEARESDLERLVDERTRWAEDEQRRRETWVRSLEAELEEARGQRDDAMRRGEELGRELQRRSDEIDAIFRSHSWRVTAPLRVGRRVMANARHLRVWDPRRWGLLLSQGVRNLATVGISGTLQRMQRYEAEREPPAASEPTRPEWLPNEDQLPTRLPVSAAPAVSIVIPAYNQLAHTAACLASIADARCDTPYEVIVVDDASSDATAERLAAVEGLRLLRNEENAGFIRSCNRGLAAATGDFVLFLNNDTQVPDKWLDNLLDTFETRPDAGLVGARLVYPDGRLQECGGLVFNDGSGWNYGRGDDPERPEYQALREVDYCSGACIVLRRDLMERLGGFDPHFAPAYYEDTDLAFRIRAEGLKVYVQPRATVTHFEGVTSGTDLDRGTKRYQVVNREKFLDRWRDALADQPAPIEDPEDRAALVRARDHRLAGRVLVVDAYTPEPDQDSGSVRLVNLMGCLQGLGYGVTFFPDNRAWDGRYTRDLQAMGVEAWYDPWLRSPERFLEAHGATFSHVFVSRHYVATHYLAAVRKHAPAAKFVFDTVDLHFLREQRLAELENSMSLRQVAKQTRRSELGVIRAADATLVVSSVERELLAREAPDAEVFILSNIHAVKNEVADFGERSDLYFVGGYQHPPNIDAARWFVERIWPRIRERLPGVRFHLVGSKAPDEVRALGEAEGVRFHGFVEHLEPFLDNCRLAVAPLRYGAGVKGKVNQAMAHGQPVVATPAAVEGLHASHGEDVLVAEDSEAFADAVVRLYGDETLWRRLSEGGLRNVDRHFSRNAASRHLEALFRALDA